MRIHHMSIWWWDFIMTSCWYEDSMPRQNDDKCQYDDDAGGRSGFERFSELVDFTCNLSKWWWITPQDPSAAPIWHSDILERPKSSPKQYQCMFHIKILNHENAQFPFSPDHQGAKLSTTTPKLKGKQSQRKRQKIPFGQNRNHQKNHNNNHRSKNRKSRPSSSSSSSSSSPGQEWDDFSGRTVTNWEHSHIFAFSSSGASRISHKTSSHKMTSHWDRVCAVKKGHLKYF